MKEHEALKLALEALEAPSPMGQYKAITAIKEACWRNRMGGKHSKHYS